MKQYFHLHFLFLVMIVTTVSMAEDVPSNPPELVTLRTRYRADVQAVREPIRKKYLIALEGLLESKRKSGDLDGAISVQQELELAKGKSIKVEGGKVPEELTTLKLKYGAAVQTASEATQTKYRAALQTLQDSFTKRGNLPAALAVRQEMNATKAEVITAPGAPSPIEMTKGYLIGTKWSFPGAFNQPQNLQHIEFTKDEKVVCGWDLSKPSKWIINPDGTVQLRVWVDPSLAYTLRIDPGGQTGTLVDKDGGEHRMERRN